MWESCEELLHFVTQEKVYRHGSAKIRPVQVQQVLDRLEGRHAFIGGLLKEHGQPVTNLLEVSVTSFVRKLRVDNAHFSATLSKAETSGFQLSSGRSGQTARSRATSLCPSPGSAPSYCDTTISFTPTKNASTGSE